MDIKLLADYCIGTAEAEFGGGYIDSIFYDSGVIGDVLDMVSGSPKLLIGNKGAGKTVLFKRLEILFKQKGIPALYLTPSDIISEEPVSETPAVLKAFYFKNLIKSVAICLAKNLNGLLSEDEKKLEQVAINSGDKDPDFIEKIIPFLQCAGTIVTQRDLTAIPLSNSSNISSNHLSELIGRNLSGKKIFFLILDEPDDVRLDGQGGGRIWALLHACRELCQKVPNVRCLISLRSEIWHLLYEDSSGRKNIDQYSPLITTLNPSTSVIGKIISTRLEFIVKSTGTVIGNRNPYEFFFEGKATKLPPPATVESSTWEDYLTKQSRGRPRDSIQLIRLLALQAKKNGKNLISEREVTQCAIPFSESRIKSLYAEYGDDFPEAERILPAFAGLEFENEAELVKKFLQKRIAEFNPVVRGKKLQGCANGVFILWRILHEMGFITPRMPDASQTLGYRHIEYDEEPNFIAQNNWNNMQKACWEIHPVYRSYLYSLHDNELHRIRMIKEARDNPAFSRRTRKVKKY